MSESEFECLKHVVGEVFDVNGDGSVVKEVLVAGDGEENPTDGAEVTVSYVGRLHDNKQEFDANDTFTFTAGSGVIQGWSDVIKTMVIGEKSRVVIQANKGYGESGAGADIPPNATLEFDIQLKHFTSEKDVLGDGTIVFKTLKANPANWERPDDLAVVKVAFSIKLAANPEEVIMRYTNENALQLTIDSDDEVNAALPSAFESLLKEMTLDSIISAKVNGIRGFKQGHKHAGEDLKIDIKLIGLEKAKGFWEMNMEEKLEEGEKLKALGNDAFKKGDFQRAVRRYKAVVTNLEYIASDSKNSVADKKKANEIVKATRLNIAQVAIKEGNFTEAWTEAKKVIDVDSNNAKAYFRLGVALSGLGEHDQAERSLTRALEIQPGDAGISSELKKVKAVIKKQNEQEKKKYKGMFSKLSGFASDDRPVVSDVGMGGDMNYDGEEDLPDLIDGDNEEEEEHHHHNHEGGCCGGH